MVKASVLFVLEFFFFGDFVPVCVQSKRAGGSPAVMTDTTLLMRGSW